MEGTTHDEDKESSESLLIVTITGGGIKKDDDHGQGDVSNEGEYIPVVQMRLVNQ